MQTNCSICGKVMNVKPFRVKRLKGGKITCNDECKAELKSQVMSGKGNHQFGLIGDKNSSFAGEITISNYGYVLEYCPNHPRPHDTSNKTPRVKQHRLVIERNYNLFNPDYFENINGWIVLKEGYDVHHIDENKTNNLLNNLEILTRSEHTLLHNSNKEIIRDSSNGRIIGVLKLGELLENL